MLHRGATVEMNGLSAVSLGYPFDTVMSLRLSFQPGGHFTVEHRSDECSRSVLLVKFPIRWKSGFLSNTAYHLLFDKEENKNIFFPVPSQFPPFMLLPRASLVSLCPPSHNHMDSPFTSGGLLASSTGPIHFTLVIRHIADGSDDTNPDLKKNNHIKKQGTEFDKQSITV